MISEVWIEPVEGIITSSCGGRINPVTGMTEYHNGLDIAVPENTSVLASRSGVVTEVGYTAANGNYIRYETNDGFKILYAHLNKAIVKEGNNIKQGEAIALSGNTGRSTGPHVHYSIWKGNMLINPMQFVDLEYTDDVVEEYAQRGVVFKR